MSNDKLREALTDCVEWMEGFARTESDPGTDLLSTLYRARATLANSADAPPGETGKLNIVRSIDTTVRNEAFCRPLVWEKAWRRSDGQEILNGHGRSIGIAASEADAEEIVEAHNTALAAAQKEE